MPSLFDGIKRIPGMFGDVLDGVGQVITGPIDPSLSPEQQRQVRNRALTQAGLTAMMASGPAPVAPNIAQIFAQSAIAGQQASQSAQGQIGRQAAAQELQRAFGGGQLDRPKLQQMLVRLMASGDMESAKMVSDMIKSLPGPQVLSSGATLVDPNTGQAIATNRAPEDVDPWKGLPGEMKAALFAAGITDPAQLTPERRQAVFNEAERYRRSGGMNINLPDPAAHTNRAVQEIAAEDYKRLIEGAGAARNALADLSILSATLENTPTGAVEDLTMPLRRIGGALGLADLDKLGRQELIRGISNRLALMQKEGMTGPMSDRDIEFLQEQVPQLGNTVEGNQLLVEVAKRMQTRKVELAQMANRYLAQNGTLDANWFRHKEQWLQENPLTFSDLIERQELGPFYGLPKVDGWEDK